MEGYLSFKKGLLRFRKVEMKTYWFVLRQDPTNAEYQYVLTWYKDESKKRLKGTLNLLPSMTVLTEEFRQFFLGYYFVIKTPDNETYHFAGQSRQQVETWVAHIREAIMTDVYAGRTSPNKYMQERIINTYISNSSIALMHPLSWETLLSWRLLQIVSYVFNETELSFTICSKCNKCSGQYAQRVSLETGIFIASSLEERLSAVYPGEKISHDKTISGDVYRIPHNCKRVEKEGAYFARAGAASSHRSSRLLSFPFSCIPVYPLRTSRDSPRDSPQLVQPQPKYKRCPTPTSFMETAPDSPVLPFVRHPSDPPLCRGNIVPSRSAVTSPSSGRSVRIDKSISFQPSLSQDDILGSAMDGGMDGTPSRRHTEFKPKKPRHPDLDFQRSHSQRWINSPQADEWSYNAHSLRRDRLGSLEDCLADPVDYSSLRKSLTPCPDLNRLLYPENYAKLAIISELDKYQRIGPLGYDAYSLPLRKRLSDSRSSFARPSLKSTTFQFPIGPLPVQLTKEPSFSGGGNIVINNTEYQVPRMVSGGGTSDPIYDVPHLHPTGSDPSSDTSSGTPLQTSYKPKRYSNKRKSSSYSSNLSSTTLSESLAYSPDDSDSGPDRITML